MAENYNGVRYFGENNLNGLWQLARAEEVISAFEGRTEASSLDEAVELYNIQNLINAGTRASLWDDTKASGLKGSVEPYIGICARFFASITDENIAGMYSQLWFLYRDDFWRLFDKFCVYKRISGDVFISLLCGNGASLQFVLKHNDTVKAYNDILADYIRASYEAIDLIITHFWGIEKEKLYLPEALNRSEYDGMFVKYIAWEGANANKLMLLTNAQGLTDVCPVSDETRLAARHAYINFCQDRRKSGAGIDFVLKVGFADIPEISRLEQEGRDQRVTYGLKWLEENLDYPTILNNFIYVFEQADSCYRSKLPAFCHEMGALESAFTPHGRKMYRFGVQFMNKHALFDGQMAKYYDFLEIRGIRMEDVFRWFFTEYLPSEFGTGGFVFNPPSAGTSWLEKYKLLVSEVDAVIKQYDMYLKHGLINRELFEMSSNPVRISDLPGYLNDKYAYSASNKLLKEMTCLFSDQTALGYTEKTKDKYQTLYHLLVSGENIKISDFIPCQVNEINWLMDRNTIRIDNDGCIRLNPERCFLLKDLYKHDVLCPRYYSDAVQAVIEELKDASELDCAGTLLSKPEQEYFNYVMNKEKYSNGLDLRNKYLHGTYTTDIGMQHSDYMQLLKIMVMIIIKINEEFIIRSERK